MRSRNENARIACTIRTPPTSAQLLSLSGKNPAWPYNYVFSCDYGVEASHAADPRVAVLTAFNSYSRPLPEYVRRKGADYRTPGSPEFTRSHVHRGHGTRPGTSRGAKGKRARLRFNAS